jgi:SAM-dependent methyltransferase
MIVNKKTIEKSLGFEIQSENLSKRIEKESLYYKPLNKKDLQDYILMYLNTLECDLIQAGESRKDQWEDGWAENVSDLESLKDFSSLIPRYHTKNNIAKFNKQIIKTSQKDFDYQLNSFFVDAVLLKHGEKFKNIFEFGCGTGYHLFRLQKEWQEKELCGLDWAKSSQEAIRAYCKMEDIKNISAKNFNYFDPDYSVDVSESCIYTVASLEQIAERHDKFIDYILDKRPSLCINFEPISEVLDEANLIDNLTKRYFKKRNYLKKYLTRLKELEKEGRIEILEVRRLNYGSKFVEGHTLIIWKPV